MSKQFRSFILIFTGIVLVFSAGLKIPLLDTKTESYFRDAIVKAGLAYSTIRVINASVSIIKDSSLHLEPAGVGVSLAVGQALDPIDDMTERLSDVLVTAITSLGVQKLAYEICLSLIPPVVGVLLLIFSILLLFENKRIFFAQKTLMRLLFLLLVARFCLPLSSIANEFVHENFFIEKITLAKNELAVSSSELDKLKDVSLPEIDGVIGTIENSTVFLKKKSIAFKKALTITVDNMGSIIENLLELTFLYVGIFIIQVIVFPILSFWLLIRISNSLFDTKLP